MLEKYIVPGQKIELRAVNRVKLSGNETQAKTYASKIYDILDEDKLEVVMPMEHTKLILLTVGGEYEVVFYSDIGLYECVCRIIDRYKSNNVYILMLEMITNLRKYQRREYYRFSCALDMNTRQLAEEEIEATEKHQKYLVPGLPLKRSIIVDISGGGIRFISDYPYEKDSLIYCNYQLLCKDVQKNYEIVSKVLDVRPIPNRPGEYEHRAQYVNLDNAQREEIIQFIFESERRNRKRDSSV